ncbi:MAG: YbjN domain-containing protein [Endozoicomonas sp.]|uniref:YbjN domain-containing protein n=1 Tax=Endozoicomonas sp. TaxID=1892382 RepID=UPI003D9B30AF
MQKLVVPDLQQVEVWLNQAGHESWMCDHCEGLHVASLQSLDGILDSRLFIEPFGILFSTELDLKAASAFSVQADLTRLNLGLPMLKLFLEMLDSGHLLLVASDVMMTTKGICYSQFCEFLEMTLDAKSWLYRECQSLQYILSEQEHFVPPVEGKFSFH